ncbi:hypothetical protein OAL47_02645 [Verrucomicrobia bacterium]|nr:hypothetical protein [Verrucomicrobiota bacterium]
MKKFKCQYSENETIRTIEAESSEEAYKAFLDQEGIKPDFVYVSDGGFYSLQDKYEGHFDKNAVWDEEAKKAFAKKQKQVEAKQSEAKEAAQSSLSSTDVLLKELIREQKQTNEWLKKVRWSLLMIHIIMVLWYVFGWVIFPI